MHGNRRQPQLGKKYICIRASCVCRIQQTLKALRGSALLTWPTCCECVRMRHVVGERFEVEAIVGGNHSPTAPPEIEAQCTGLRG